MFQEMIVLFPGMMGSGLGSWLQLPWVVGGIYVPFVVLVDLWESFRKGFWHCLGPRGASDLGV